MKALNAIHYHLLTAPPSALDDKPHFDEEKGDIKRLRLRD